MRKHKKGITLIALIITVIILLILAAVTIDVAGNGKEVENYGVIYDNTADASNKWRIFYADEENIYLITDDYIHADYAPDSANYEIRVRSDYELSMADVHQDYTGAAKIVE